MRPLFLCVIALGGGCVIAVGGGLLVGCSRAPSPQAQARARARADEPSLIHTPPIKQLDLKQLKALSIECEKYLPGQFARGPYEAAYCQAAIDAWGDAPLQMMRIPAPPHAN